MTAREKLAPYRGKRDFGKTPEPSGARKAGPNSPERRFVVQRHRARNLHYDFRLEIDGVLVSWAVPKGPTLSAGVRRGAYHVEDHPMEYIDFEGVIPAGEYGGGDVIVWDIGTWEPQEQDPAKAIADGELHADLHGEKLNGRFVFVRTRADDWILLHKKDAYAKPNWDPEKHPQSVLSGRTNDEVKADPDRLWRSDLPAATASLALKPDAGTEADPDELKALDRLKTQGTWHVFGRDLKVTNLDKVLFPGRGRGKPITKRDFLRYTAQIAPTILPYLTRRPLNLHRYPDGAGTKGFWQKELPGHAPDWLARWDNPDAAPGDSRTYLVADEPAALLWAANSGALEWHAWTSQVDKPDKPTYALIDLDPGTDTKWADLVALARLHRDALDHLGVLSRAKLTGKRGIQIWIPITRGPSYATTRAWVEKLSRTVAAAAPELVSWKWQKSERDGLARLDYTQNAIGNTLVAPYSPRPAAGAPVSAPIHWDELSDRKLRPDTFTMKTVLRRLATEGDPFHDVVVARQKLPRLK
ncbi:bifunctional non-homologous end joining protein LigD [Asanoa ishikariensis]|uniref:Bifunctional non-homologous end joining protein LigD n=1 Tax=Asanoa ishikariensis TaxID=137265 RepID=A0A1H3THE1_9ACTN|nr:non-homologous end-joining DNA ligase [Asanoa ishikariensis]SDZ49407.1 bifunctional non-homologous end joining protein LigD [Asanoa ishikariensis]